ncbi:Pr6Pr family membrane protein [Streptomyces sp. NPDC046909]|uniref:Pr6Pr family membrane protein n=1 Tax=Streptomyces sp. NPDC046909 TaxID=3155617 RepID=UPI0033C8FDEA
MTRALPALRLAFGLLLGVALGFAGYHASTSATGVPNFFSYFTNLSNMAACVVLLVGTRTRVPDPVRGAVVLYMAITGLVYGLVLTKFHDSLMIPWVNHVVHQLMPLVVVADWLADPPRRRLRYGQAAYWLVFPLAYLTYSLIRGAVLDWYPYPFLDPDHDGGGYERVAVACLLITALFVGVGALIVKVGNVLVDRLGSGPRTAAEADRVRDLAP